LYSQNYDLTSSSCSSEWISSQQKASVYIGANCQVDIFSQVSLTWLHVEVCCCEGMRNRQLHADVACYLFLIPQPGNWDRSNCDHFYINLQVKFQLYKCRNWKFRHSNFTYITYYSIAHRQAVCNLPGGYSTILPHKGLHCSNWFLSDDTRWACLEESMAPSLTVISLLLHSTTHCRYRVYTKFLLTYTAIYQRNRKVLPLVITVLQPQSHFHLGTPYILDNLNFKSNIINFIGELMFMLMMMMIIIIIYSKVL
jgi:hypothetical protein